uniref:ATP synthase complex subunit 8 n=2 Tax=Cambaroides TaxID=72435 RepID=A0AA51BSX5_9EUCA|nr:ATP synthase F0 subunit 8 [Cambaroides dauricus]APS87223.1 ATP synthase F0 subunit 8 [Cambaroides dauricus]UXP34370.1 ATP synthase F0 subunit 8 [Cambaroides dauricus]WMI51881.1 ATP synthase F0 subunit 8 [Cambaroides wladiwostokiensis]
MPQMSPILWVNLYFMFLLSLALILVIQYFFSLNLKSGLKEAIYLGNEKVWKW